MALVNALVIFFAIIGLFFAASFVYGLLSAKKSKTSENAVTVEKGFLSSAIINHEECPYVFSSPKRVYSESNSSIFMTMSAVIDGKSFPDLKVGETRITFIQAVNNGNSPFTPKHLQKLIIETDDEIMDIPNGSLPAELPKDVIMKVRNEMNWGPIDFEVYHRMSFMSSFSVDVSDFESFVKDIKTIKLGYNNDSQDILLSESEFVSIDKSTFTECTKTAVLEWTQAIRDKVDSIQVVSNNVTKG